MERWPYYRGLTSYYLHCELQFGTEEGDRNGEVTILQGANVLLSALWTTIRDWARVTVMVRWPYSLVSWPYGKVPLYLYVNLIIFDVSTARLTVQNVFPCFFGPKTLFVNIIIIIKITDCTQGFFRRTVKERDSLKYQCSNSGNCQITTQTRNGCKFCRYKKCLDVRMTPAGVYIVANWIYMSWCWNALICWNVWMLESSVMLKWCLMVCLCVETHCYVEMCGCWNPVLCWNGVWWYGVIQG